MDSEDNYKLCKWGESILITLIIAMNIRVSYSRRFCQPYGMQILMGSEDNYKLCKWDINIDNFNNSLNFWKSYSRRFCQRYGMQILIGSDDIN